MCRPSLSFFHRWRICSGCGFAGGMVSAVRLIVLLSVSPLLVGGCSRWAEMWLTWPGNYVDVEMSANAAGIVATLYALNGFAEQVSPVFREKHRQLYDYIESHPEAQAIYAAIE